MTDPRSTLRTNPVVDLLGDPELAHHVDRSTILTSQLPPKIWHDHVGGPTIADAICDRLLHNAHKTDLKGESRWKEKKARSQRLSSLAPLRSRSLD